MRKAAYSGSDVLRIGVFNVSMVKRGQSGELFMQASIVSCLDPFRMTGHVWQKSPSRMTTLPPNGAVVWVTFRQISSMQARTALFVIGASSQVIMEAFRIRSARESCMLIEEVSISLSSSTEICANDVNGMKGDQRKSITLKVE